MGYRRFTDRDGGVWEVRDRSRYEWEFVPTAGNPAERLTVQVPIYEGDPFEMSNEEIQRVLDKAGSHPTRRTPKSSPFQDP